MAPEHESIESGDTPAAIEPTAPGGNPQSPVQRPESPRSQEQSFRWESAGHRRSGSTGDLPQMMLLWCLWLLGSWVVIRNIDGFHIRELAFGIFSPASPPSAKWMVFAALMGLMLIWPLFRLSQRRPVGRGLDPQQVARVLVDWLGMMLLLQLVLWPLQAMGEWSIGQVAWMDTMIASWSLLTGVIVAWGTQFPGWGMRVVAMVLCVALVFAEPLILGLLNAAGSTMTWTLTISPLGVLTGLAVRYYDFSPEPWAWHIIAAAAAAAVAWVSLLVTTVRSQGRSRRHGV